MAEDTGIGLVVTKRLVELMGGAIGADSTVGTESVFRVELGLSPAPLLLMHDIEHPASGSSEVLLNNPVRTVLYVEDNPANLELIEQLVSRRSDLPLLSAADGNSGV